MCGAWTPHSRRLPCCWPHHACSQRLLQPPAFEGARIVCCPSPDLCCAAVQVPSNRWRAPTRATRGLRPTRSEAPGTACLPADACVARAAPPARRLGAELWAGGGRGHDGCRHAAGGCKAQPGQWASAEGSYVAISRVCLLCYRVRFCGEEQWGASVRGVASVTSDSWAMLALDGSASVMLCDSMCWSAGCCVYDACAGQLWMYWLACPGSCADISAAPT